MYLILSIVLAIILSYILFIIGPVGYIIAFGIVLGCLFRGLYLLNDISKRFSNVAPKPDRVKEVYEAYLKEKENTTQG